MNYVKIMMVKRDKREIEQLRDIIQSVAAYELVGICDNGQDAVRGIAEKNPDIVILDEVLPGKDVLEIAESVIHNKNLKNVKLTASEKENFFARYENAKELLETYSLEKAKSGEKAENDYAALQLAAKQKGRVRKSKKAQQKEAYLRYKNEALCGCRPPEEARAILTEMQIEELCTLADEAFLKG